MSDGKVVDAVGIGNIQLKLQVQRKATLYNVLHVPALKKYLFSVRSARSRRKVVQLSHSRCWILGKANQVHTMETLIGKLSYLDLEFSDHEVNLVAYNNVWHQRLAHINQATIKVRSSLSKSQTVDSQ